MRQQKAEFKYFASFDGAKICYQTQIVNSNDEVLIMLHGLGGDLTAWDEERKILQEQGISTIVMDLRGHGLSARSRETDFYELRNFAKDVIELIRVEKIKRPILVGHCLGGTVAILTESYFPAKARALILIGTGFRAPQATKILKSRKWLSKILHLMAKLLPNFKIKGHRNFGKYKNGSDLDWRRLTSDILHTSIPTYLLMLEKVVNYDVEKILEKMRLPVLIIEGTNDSIFPPLVAQQLHKMIRNSKLSYVANANHILIISNPDEVAEEIVKFVVEARIKLIGQVNREKI